MAQVSKRYKALAVKVDRNKLYALDEALKLVKGHYWRLPGGDSR